MDEKEFMRFSTKAIHIGSKPNLKEGGSGDVIPPIHLASTFAREKVDKPTAGFEYSRTGNPTRTALEKNLASLEEGKYALCFSSGLAAITNILFLLKRNDHLISVDDVYGGTARLFQKVFSRFGLKVKFLDLTRPENFKAKILKETKMVWFESPTNPLLKIIDIKKIAKIAKKRKILSVVDNTFASPYFQKPLTLGVDIVVHSTTKYIGGHSDVVGGAVVIKDKKLYQKLKFLQNAIGAVPSPFDCWLTLRGIKTLSLRMEKHQENAFKIAKFLEGHSKVKKVIYPGLPSHPQQRIAKKQMTGFSGIVSFELKRGIKKVIKFLESLKIILLAESLGAVESLIEHPASMTHASLAKSKKERIGLNEGLIRLSVGVEEAKDLIEDLRQGLAKI